MSIQVELDTNEKLSLEDAIAYEFYMDNIMKIIKSEEASNAQDYGEVIAKLAVTSYEVARIFSAARNHHFKQSNDTDS